MTFSKHVLGAFLIMTQEFLDIRAMAVKMVFIILLFSDHIMGKLTPDRNKTSNWTAQSGKQTYFPNVSQEAVTWSNTRSKIGELINLTSAAKKSSQNTSKIRTKSGKLSKTETKDGHFPNVTTNFKALLNATSNPGAMLNIMSKFHILPNIKSQSDRSSLNSSICDVMSYKRYIIADKDENVGMLEYLLQERVTCPVDYRVYLSSSAGSIFNLEFTYFRTRHCTDHCLCDSLTMYDVVNGELKVRNSFCGIRETWSVLSKSNHVILQMTLVNGAESYYTLLYERSDLCYWSALPYYLITGYVVMYQVLPARHNEWMSPVKKLTNDSDLVYPVNPQIRIGDSLVYKWHIRIRPDKQIIFQYRRFCLEPNLKVYDGPAESPKYTPISTKKPVDNRIAKGFQIFITYTIKRALVRNNRLCLYVFYQSINRRPLPCSAQKTYEYYKMYINRGKPWPTFFAMVAPDCALRFHPKLFIIEHNSPNHDNCAYRGVAVLNPASPNGVIFLCNMMDRNMFSNYKINVPHFINMTFIVYHYGFDDINRNCYVDLSGTVLSRGQALLCKPIFTMFDLNQQNNEVWKSYYSNGSTHVHINPENEPCIYFIFPPQDNYHINQNITFEIYGVKNVLFSSDPLHQPQYVKALGCKHNTGVKEQRYSNTILFNYQMNCPFIYEGVLLRLINKMTCNEAKRNQLISLRESCLFFTATNPHYIKINSRFACHGMLKLTCVKPGCFSGHHILKFMVPLQVGLLRTMYDDNYVTISQTIIYQMPVILKPCARNGRWAISSYFVLLGDMNLVYEPLQQEYMFEETKQLFLQLERYSQPDIFSTPSDLFYYGYNSTGYELYKKYGYTEPVSYEGYKYKHCIGENMDWYEAKSQCERIGMTLLTIDTLRELHFLKGFLQGFWVQDQRRIIPIIHFIGLQVSKTYPYQSCSYNSPGFFLATSCQSRLNCKVKGQTT